MDKHAYEHSKLRPNGADSSHKDESGHNDNIEETRSIKSDSTTSFELAKTPWRYKAVVLLCCLFMSMGSHYANNTLSSLKSTLKKDLHITNTQFGALTSTVFLINTIMPFIGGVAMDTLGTGSGAILSTMFVLVGSILAGVAAVSGKYGVLVLSRVVFGLGSGFVVTVQEVILSHWFRGTGLGTVIGLQIAVSKFAQWLAQTTVLPIRDATGHYANSFWVASGLCGVSLVLVLIYLAVLRRATRYAAIHNNDTNNGAAVAESKVNGSSDDEDDDEHDRKPKSTFQAFKKAISNISRIPDAYWIIPFNNFALGSVWTPFLLIAVEFLQLRWKQSDVVAAWTSSISLAIPIATSPLVGLFIDRFGQRGQLAIFSAVLLVLSQILLSYTWAHPLAGMTLFSLSIVFGPVSITSGVALTVPPKYLGAAMGIAKLGLNTGVALFDVVVGLVQDGTPGGGYERVSVMFLIMSCIGVLTTAVYSYIDYTRLDGVMNASHSTRTKILEKRAAKHKKEEEDRRDGAVKTPKTLGLPLRPTQIVIYATTFALFVLAWVMYCVFLFGKS
ncbi:MFS general substrate transporter [Ramicandelaber brevisporus]|nr:MFS general substrate transporter [Ramicandelaber brevisporus]